MEQVIEKSKEYEILAIKYDPIYADLIKAIKIVKDFIIDNNLIIYGGSAIDYALRLKGDQIYPTESLAIPDLDFLSPDSVQHTYELADILYKAGFKQTRAIVAMHVHTMRVDIADNHFIADITYCPPEIFKKIPYLEYNEMRCVHPDFQRIDLHSSLSFPYDNPPLEVIFNRWAKDIKRFNLLDKYYPIQVKGETRETKLIEIPLEISKYVLNGFAAYNLIYRVFSDLVDIVPDDIYEGVFEVNDVVKFKTMESILDLVHFDIHKCSKELNLTDVKEYEPYISILPEIITGEADMQTKTSVHIYSTKNRMVSVNTVKINETNFRVVNIQYLMRHFIALSNTSEHKTRALYLTLYLSLQKMISEIEKLNISKELIKDTPLMLSISTYGSENNSLSYERLLNNLLHDISGAPLHVVPKNYYPENSITKGMPKPTFDYESSELFRERGRLKK
jgi:hypothetical protein